MHILFVLESFFPTHRAGTEIYVLNLCRYLLSKGYKVEVLISTTTETGDYEYEGIQVYTFKVPPKPIAKELNGIIPPRGIGDFIERIKAINPDLVHFHSFGRAINGYHLQAVKELGIKTAFTPHLATFFCIKSDLRLFNSSNCDGEVLKGRCLHCFLKCKEKRVKNPRLLSIGIQTLNKLSISKKLLPPFFSMVEHRINEIHRVKQHCDLTFAIAPWIQKVFDKNQVTSTLIPQGINKVFLNHKPITDKPLKQRINFAYIGRMHPIKGFHLLKEAWESLQKSESVLHIITTISGGEDKYFDTNKQWAIENSNVKWYENLSQDEVASYLNNIDVLILPSYTEMAPLVILEAAAFGIPTIGSDYIAIKDMVEHGKNGLLFKNGDWHDLKHQLETIINQPDLITALKQNIQPPVSMSVVAELIEKEYFKVLMDKW